MKKRRNTKLDSKTTNSKKSSKNKLRPVDIIVIILCFAGTAVSLNLFRLDLYATVRNLNAVPLGVVGFKYNTAQRRLGNRVLWDRLRQDSPIYNGDIIRTANLSEAIVYLTEGREISLGENTLIQIRMRGGNAEIDLSDGYIGLSTGSVDTKGGVILNVGGSRVEAGAGTELSISADAGSGRGLVLQVAKGSAVLSGSEGRRQTATAGTAVFLDGTGAGKSAVLVSAPLSNAQFFTPQQEVLPVSFSWNKVNLPASETLQLEIAENRSFTRTYQTISAAGTNARAELPPGTWQWRIRRETENIVLSSGRLTVLHTPAPSLIAPAQDYTYNYWLKLPKVCFQWQKIERASSYKIEVADNRGFINPLLSLNVKGTSFESSNFGAGTWYWRVTPVFPGDNQGVGVSASASFNIVQNGILKAPVLISPKTGGIVNISAAREICFSWHKDNEAASYAIQIARNRNLENPVIKETVKDSFFIYKSRKDFFGEGQYYWAVYQTDIEKNQSPLSSVYSFTVVAEEPVQRPVFPPDNHTIAEKLLPDTPFTWKANSTSGNRFQVSGNLDFSMFVINERTYGESFRIRSLPPGTYYWRVSGNSSTGPTRRFTVVPALPVTIAEAPLPGTKVIGRTDESLGTLSGDNISAASPQGLSALPIFFPEPAGLRPEDGWVVGPEELRISRSIVFSWKAVEGASAYIFSLYRRTDAGRQQIVRTEPLNQQSWVLKDLKLLDQGDFVWQVEAVMRGSGAFIEQRGRVAENRFRLELPLPSRVEINEAGIMYGK
jgi:hypothetical protein